MVPEGQQSVTEWKEVPTRLMWVTGKFTWKLWVFIGVYGPGWEKKEEGREDFWMDGKCVQSFGVNVNVVLFED